ncbi:hypothetical protein MKX01_007637, partial [Papaver californicum]
HYDISSQIYQLLPGSPKKDHVNGRNEREDQLHIQPRFRCSPPEEAIPKCCVSFSAFYNESAIPCQTCALVVAIGSRAGLTMPLLLMAPPLRQQQFYAGS